NLSPSKISFRRGGYITGVIGILIMPWKLVADPTGYIFTWLVGYSALLGSIGGVLIADYFVLRKKTLDLLGLYQEPTAANPGPYWYGNGFNRNAFLALAAGILPNLPGFVGTVKWAKVAPFWTSLYSYAWFVGFGLSFVVYLALEKARKA
ncbi:MAG: cytosine permease, partial [Myxococcales bacterium]|nr:cytosine permease [Myxococcales bacterium]